MPPEHFVPQFGSTKWPNDQGNKGSALSSGVEYQAAIGVQK